MTDTENEIKGNFCVGTSTQSSGVFCSPLTFVVSSRVVGDQKFASVAIELEFGLRGEVWRWHHLAELCSLSRIVSWPHLKTTFSGCCSIKCWMVTSCVRSPATEVRPSTTVRISGTDFRRSFKPFLGARSWSMNWEVAPQSVIAVPLIWPSRWHPRIMGASEPKSGESSDPREMAWDAGGELEEGIRWPRSMKLLGWRMPVKSYPAYKRVPPWKKPQQTNPTESLPGDHVLPTQSPPPDTTFFTTDAAAPNIGQEQVAPY
jgi:hypothetical protein